MPHPLTRIKNFRFETIAKELEIPTKLKAFFTTVLAAYNDDFWQNGDGSLLPPASGIQASHLNTLIEKRFIFRNVIRECVERVSKAFLGKSPNWKLQQNGSDVDSVPDGIEKALGDFWTIQNASTVLSQAFESRLATGRGGIRMFVPVKFKRQAAVTPVSTGSAPDIASDSESALELEYKDFVKFASVEDALRAIRIEFIDPKESRLLNDDAELFSIVQYRIREDWENDEETNVIEFSFVDDRNLTFIGLVPERGRAAAADVQTEEFPITQFIKSDGFDLNGATTFNEMEGIPYVTAALYKNNQLLNLALTCAGFSLVDNGFGEVFLTNVSFEMESYYDPESGETLERPKKMIRGGGAVQSLVGITTVNEETGQEQVQTPGVNFKEPTPLNAFVEGKDLAYTACLEEAGQLYAKISGDATASGESRVQAMKDFYLKIIKYKSEVDQMGGWLMTTALRWAVDLAGDAGLKGSTVVFDSKIFIGDVTKEERSTLTQMWKDGVISLETCRVLSGVDDPALEGEQVISEADESIDEVSVGEADRRADLANKLDGLLPKRRVRKIAFGYSEAELDAVQAELDEESQKALDEFTAQEKALSGGNSNEENPDDLGAPDDAAAAA